MSAKRWKSSTTSDLKREMRDRRVELEEALREGRRADVDRVRRDLKLMKRETRRLAALPKASEPEATQAAPEEAPAESEAPAQE